MQHPINFAHKFADQRESELPDLTEVMSRSPGKQSIDARSAYRFLSNIDEFPEMLPLAYQFITQAIENVNSTSPLFSNGFNKNLAELPQHLSKFAESFELESFQTEALTGNKNLAQQLAPTMFVTGSWLQNLSRAATAHTTVASKLNKVFCLQTTSYSATNKTNLLSTYRESSSSRNLLICDKTQDYAFEFPLVLMSFAQFPREFLPELLGLNLAWHYLGINAFVEFTCLQNFFDEDLSKTSLADFQVRNEKMAELSLEAIETFYQEQDSADQSSIKKRILNGIEIFTNACVQWLENAKASKENDSDPQKDMLALIKNKAPHAIGYHRDKKLGRHKIDDLLNSSKFDPQDVLEHLANSPYVVAGNADKSPFATKIVAFGGPMAGIFNEPELTVIRFWINNLDQDKKPHQNKITEQHSAKTRYPFWEKSNFLHDSSAEYANGEYSLRELYYKLVNIEYFPDILPVAEHFLRDRISRVRSTLTNGERPLPSNDYSEATLENWVHNKHREQIDAYRPSKGEPDVSKQTFIDATTALAPLLLIDGAWLQGTTSANTIHTPVGQSLYRIFYEEIGEGTAELHHANLYRELLDAMDVQVPDVSDLDFALSEHFDDSAFEVPALWLSLSCFTRHYFPELLGINLAVELAGIGAGYMEAHDTLDYFGLPTTFVDFHNSTDNASTGHAALAMNAIKTHMREVAQHEGHHNLNAHWHRVWTGMCLTLPSISDTPKSDLVDQSTPPAIFAFTTTSDSRR